MSQVRGPSPPRSVRRRASVPARGRAAPDRAPATAARPAPSPSSVSPSAPSSRSSPSTSHTRAAALRPAVRHGRVEAAAHALHEPLVEPVLRRVHAAVKVGDRIGVAVSEAPADRDVVGGPGAHVRSVVRGIHLCNTDMSCDLSRYTMYRSSYASSATSRRSRGTATSRAPPTSCASRSRPCRIRCAGSSRSSEWSCCGARRDRWCRPRRASSWPLEPAQCSPRPTRCAATSTSCAA